jgi:hypothetical protein
MTPDRIDPDPGPEAAGRWRAADVAALIALTVLA